MTKVIARYIFLALCPMKLGFFRPFGISLHDDQKLYDRAHSFNSEFWMSLLVCLTLFGVGLYINPLATFWFFVLIAPHSQWNLTGQFFAERYLYLPIAGICGLIGVVLQPYPVLLAVAATILAFRTHQYIPYWRHQETLWENDTVNFPEYANTWNNRAQYYMGTGKLSVERVNELAAWLNKAMRMSPNSWEIHMNTACFNVFVGNIPLGLQYTRSAIKLLEPLGGEPTPLTKLYEQEKALTKRVEGQQRGRLGESLSRPNTKGEKRNGKSKTKNKTTVLK